MEYLRELLANTERQSDVANNTMGNNGSGGKENRNKRPLSGNKHRTLKIMEEVTRQKRPRIRGDVGTSMTSMDLEGFLDGNDDVTDAEMQGMTENLEINDKEERKK